ncbi:DUF418 domain-containing protein [Nonomuraea sp. NBC_01738]|uniref:DUF418 domain-containing protein n=1 Tax=Nonomuraea sp. NBC_01738 TaxID=2976003 RepID=UPI002E166DA8|nr:DUF418 domain-containing protein [Nonomuraea sp. NBC_01738]
MRPRIHALDVIRGFALCGILLANIQPIANAGAVVIQQDTAQSHPWLGLLVDQRFFPIFSLLFGIGFSLLHRSAEHPHLLLLRRLLALLGIGLAHMFLLWRGDILTIYAVVGLVVLLPSTWLPRLAVACLAPVLLVIALVTGGNGFVLVPGLFLLGSALTRYGIVDRFEGRAGPRAVLALGFAAAAAPVLWWQANGGALAFPVGGLLVAGAYVCGLLALLGTPLGPFLRWIFAPLGRMALTNYLSATVLVLVVARFAGTPPETWPVGLVLLIAAAILSAQWAWSALWLRRHRQGPVEWLWRWATWLRRPPLTVDNGSRTS